MIYNVSEKIDWENHELSNKEASQKGPGEHGKGIPLNVSEKRQIEELMKVNGFNALASDKISLKRSINDLRLSTCRSLTYSRDLPQATIIIPFHDEHLSTLLRTVHTLLLRAPQKLINEVILIDDFSTKEFLKSELEEYVTKNFNNVRIIKTEKREGLIRARLLGANAAKAPILIFIDSHCEAGINWLPPLLQPIYENDRTVTCPFIDVINYNDFSIRPQDEGARGAFDWNLDYKRLPRLEEDNKNPEKPFASPIMAGGLFAISKKWFWELGGYDSGLEVWGGEQYELSFKIWMCGGTMVDVPCSRIAHVYRKFNPFGVPSLGDFLSRNYKRIAEVWMDKWKIYVYNKKPGRYVNIDAGDLIIQRELRSKLNCHSFNWFMKFVAFDLTKHYPVRDSALLANGKIISNADPTMCMDTKYGTEGDEVFLETCNSEENEKPNTEQSFQFSSKFDIRPQGRNVCFDYPGYGRVVFIFDCKERKENQLWKYNMETGQLIHVHSKKCVDSKPERSEIFMDVCKPNITQRWTLEDLII